MEATPATGSAQAQQASDVQPYRWMILALTSTCFILTFVARFAWPPLIPVVVPILGIKMSEAGAYMSAFYIGYVITQIPAGLLADRFGVRLILGLSLIIEGISTFGMGYISTYDAGFALRVITGLGAGAVFSSCARALMEWFPPRERGTAFGIMLGAPSGGILLSSIAVPPLNTLLGWQGAFKSIGLVTALVGVLLYFLIRTSSQAKQGGNIAAGTGARLVLVSAGERRKAEELAGRVRYLELGAHSEFGQFFARALRFPRPGL